MIVVLRQNEQFLSYIMAGTSYTDMMMVSALYWTNTINWIFTALVHWNNSPGVDTSFYSDALFWFRAYRIYSYLLNLRAYQKSIKC